MGWAGGSRLMDEVIEVIAHEVRNEGTRKRIYRGLISAFEGEDADTLADCKDKDRAYDEAYDEMNPPEEFDESP